MGGLGKVPQKLLHFYCVVLLSPGKPLNAGFNVQVVSIMYSCLCELIYKLSVGVQ